MFSGAPGADSSSGGVKVPLSSGVWIGLQGGSLRPAHLDNHSQLLRIYNKFVMKEKGIPVKHFS